ncbi:nucleoside-diphosphate sugar epimerase/dehydratase [Collinsella stercoris]|nr:FAD/NAD(P)-binding oxidoreductase [Collinsella stercoris]UEA44735.1 NAD(P)/FAD-dependent oxidoreductase [Collinsella stercoris DSM 13279]UWP10798.1 NAD(P)/FAD-dependent oxidoreductase [Collinsella stercoris]
MACKVSLSVMRGGAFLRVPRVLVVGAGRLGFSAAEQNALARAHKLGLQVIVFTDMDSEHAGVAFEAMEGRATVISDDFCDSRGSNSRITYGLDSHDGCRTPSSNSSAYSGVSSPSCVCPHLPLCCGGPDLPMRGCGSDLPSRADADACLLRPAARANVLAELVAACGWGFDSVAVIATSPADRDMLLAAGTAFALKGAGYDALAAADRTFPAREAGGFTQAVDAVCTLALPANP